MLFGRAELSELLFRDKAKSTLLSINGALMSNGNKGITAKFKWPCHLPRVRILEDYIKKLIFIYEDNFDILEKSRVRN